MPPNTTYSGWGGQLHSPVEYYNQKFIDMWQMPRKFTQDPDWQLFINEIFKKLKHPQIFLANIDELQANPQQERFDEIVSINNNVFEWHAKPHKMHDKIAGRVWSFRDITLRKQMEQQLAYQANHDLLTGLPNRTLLYGLALRNLCCGAKPKATL